MNINGGSCSCSTLKKYGARMKASLAAENGSEIGCAMKRAVSTPRAAQAALIGKNCKKLYSQLLNAAWVGLSPPYRVNFP